MIIGIVPTIRSPYKDQIEFTFDKRLIKFLLKVDKKVTIKLLDDESKIDKNFKLIVFSGGNDLLKFSKLDKDKSRNKIDNIHYRKAKKLRLPMLGICYGATFVANKFNAKFVKKKKVGNHKISLLKNNFFTTNNKYINVNSFKNYSISSLNKKIEILGQHRDNTVEAFYINEIKFLGLMWHPERYKKFKKIDFDIIKNLI